MVAVMTLKLAADTVGTDLKSDNWIDNKILSFIHKVVQIDIVHRYPKESDPVLWKNS